MTQKKQTNYVTLASSSKSSVRPYRDRDSLPFEATYPIVKFSDDFIDVNAGQDQLAKYCQPILLMMELITSVRFVSLDQWTKS